VVDIDEVHQKSGPIDQSDQLINGAQQTISILAVKIVPTLRFKELYTKLKSEYKFIKQAPKRIREKHDDLCKQLRNAKKNVKDKIENAYRRDYFFCIHNEIMERQLNKSMVEEEVEPVVKHQLEERTQFQEVLRDFSKDLGPQDIVSRKVFAINLIIALASRQEFQTHKPRLAPAPQVLIKKECPAPDPFLQLYESPLVCEKT
jgi:cell division protein ZapA (FtsZ GTPase activity inhibitor)